MRAHTCTHCNPHESCATQHAQPLYALYLMYEACQPLRTGLHSYTATLYCRLPAPTPRTQVCQVVLSFLMFPKPLSWKYALGGLLVAIALVWLQVGV